MRFNTEHGRLARWIEWRACDVGEVKEGLENELCRRWSNERVGEWALQNFTYVTTLSPTLPSLYLHYSSFFNPSITSPTSQLILQPFFRFSYVASSSLNSPGEPPMFLIEWAELILETFRHFTYITTHSPTFPSLYLRHSSFSNPSVTSPTSQLILQPFFRFSYVTSYSLNSPGEPPMFLIEWAELTLPSLYLRHSSFSNPSVASPTSQFILQPFFRFCYVTSSSLNSPGDPPMFLIEWAELILEPLHHFTYVRTHSPTLPSFHLRHSWFSDPSVASPTSQFILQPYFRFSYVPSSSLSSLGEPPMLPGILSAWCAYRSLHFKTQSQCSLRYPEVPYRPYISSFPMLSKLHVSRCYLISKYGAGICFVAQGF